MTAAPERPSGPPELGLDAPAKINLFLEVLGKREDGYHEIETVMQAVGLSDRLEFWRRPAGEFSISVAGGPAPADEDNLALRAARLLARESGEQEGIHIHLEKRIPVGGGLGGGSSDAAAALRGLDRLWGLGARREDLANIGSKLGSDVNFFLSGGTAVCRGRGELVEPLEVHHAINVLLYIPQRQVATRDIYARLRMPLTSGRRSCHTITKALKQGAFEDGGRELFNRLEEPVFELYPDLAAARSVLTGEGALGTLLSGSGSTVFVLTTPEAADGLKAELEEKLRSGVILAVGSVASWG